VAVAVSVAAVWDVAVAVAVLDDAALDDYSSGARQEDGVEEDHTDRVDEHEGNVTVERDDTPEEEGVGEDQNDADGRCYYYYYPCSQYYP